MRKWISIAALLLVLLAIQGSLLNSALGLSSNSFRMIKSNLGQYTIDEIVRNDLNWAQNARPGILTHSKKDIWIHMTLPAQLEAKWVFELPTSWIHEASLEVSEHDSTESIPTDP